MPYQLDLFSLNSDFSKTDCTFLIFCFFILTTTQLSGVKVHKDGSSASTSSSSPAAAASGMPAVFKVSGMKTAEGKPSNLNGRYEMEEGKPLVNGKPSWRKAGGGMVLYCSNKGSWSITSPERVRENRNFLCTQRDCKMLPHEAGTWFLIQMDVYVLCRVYHFFERGGWVGVTDKSFLPSSCPTTLLFVVYCV